LVTARVEDNLAPAARAILSSEAAVDIARRREIYTGEGWTRFNESNPDYTDEEIAVERQRLRNMR
jgi:hypothetical protein